MYIDNNKIYIFHNIWKNCGKKQTIVTRIGLYNQNQGSIKLLIYAATEDKLRFLF